MAVYKVIQDIESEDKLLGPLGLKQFIYAIIAAVLAFISFRIAVTTSLGPVRWPVIVLFLLPMILFAILAAPLGGPQSTENWLLARLRFKLKPQKRIWDQSGMKELVTITAPKKIQKQYTKNLSQKEVRSRLNALAATLDSRGWAVKNVNVNLFSQPGYFNEEENSDRLIAAESLPQPVASVDVRPEDDILDPQSNATANHLDRLMKESEAKVKLEALEKFNTARGKTTPTNQAEPATDFWFMHQADPSPEAAARNETMFGSPVVARPGASNDSVLTSTASPQLTSEQEQELLKQVHSGRERRKLSQGRLPSLETKKAAVKKPTSQQQTAIIALSNNDDISVATAQKEANRIMQPKPKIQQSSDGEVVIQLH